jgi:transcriptional regulator with XRE-family HTH domain
MMKFSTFNVNKFDIFRVLNDAGYSLNTMKTKHIKLILGLKLKQFRTGREMSLSDLAAKSGLSVSYLNEIESGKKYPKADKIAILAEALGTTYDRLISLKLTKNLAPVAELLESNILEQLPLDHYGIDLNKLISLMTNSSPQLSALIATFIETAQSSELSQNNFSRNALRNFKEFSENYFEEFEDAVKCFAEENNITNKYKVELNDLKKILERNFNYEVNDTIINNYPELSELRAVAVKNNRVKLLLNNNLSEAQKIFIMGKELAYNYMGINDRSFLHSGKSLSTFDHLINYFKASYFSTALLINSDLLVSELNKIFSTAKWNNDAFLALINKFNTTTEIFFQRITNLLSRHFNLNKFFFYRINYVIGSERYDLLNELKLNTHRNFNLHQSGEHFCRRWISISILKRYDNIVKKNKSFFDRITGITLVKFFESDDEYLCISAAQRGNLDKNQLSSLTVGILIDDASKQKIKFLNDPAIPVTIVNETCERCRIKDCKERAALPIGVTEADKLLSFETALQQLIDHL